jgi:excisionase family DNA binding protein
MSEYIEVERVQERLSLSRDTVDRMIRRGDIAAVKIGKCVRVSVESLEDYLQAHTMGESTGKEA